MGGIGSGNRKWRDKRTVVEDCLTLNINQWLKASKAPLTQGQVLANLNARGSWTFRYSHAGETALALSFELNPYRLSCPFVRLSYSIAGKTISYLVRLDATRQQFG